MQAPWVGNHATSYTLLLRPRSFYCAVGASAMIHGALDKILKHSRSPVQWNGGVTGIQILNGNLFLEQSLSLVSLPCKI